MRQILVNSLLQTIIGEPMSFKNMTIFPLSMQGNGFHYITLDEALEQDKIEINEITQEGSVPELKAVNESDERVFLLDGEELIGAKQNRILNASIMMAPKSEINIPVSCVERGRWSYRTIKFYSGPSSHSMLRALKAASISEALEYSGDYKSDQLAIWEEIKRKHKEMKSHSPSEAYEALYDDYRKELDSYVEGLKPPEDSTGVAVIIGGKIECIDIFDSATTLRKLWSKLLKSYALGALENAQDIPSEISKKDVQSFIQRVQEGEMKAYNSVGMGKDVRVEIEDTVGSALVCDGRVVHAALFSLGDVG